MLDGFGVTEANGDDLLGADDEQHVLGTVGHRGQLAAARGGDDEVSVLGERVDAADHPLGGGAEAAHLAHLASGVHRHQLWSGRGVAAGFVDLLGQADRVGGHRRRGEHLGALGQQVQRRLPCRSRVRHAADVVAAGLQRRGRGHDGSLVSRGGKGGVGSHGRHGRLLRVVGAT